MKYSVQIDGQALKREIERKGYSYTDACNLIGRTPTFFTNIIQRGVTSESSIKLIEAFLGIPKERYVVDGEPVQEEPAPQLNEETLYKVIYAAVYEAMKKALNE